MSNLLAVTGSITSTVDKLEQKGLVQRIHERQDRRSWRIQLTPAGQELVQQHLPVHLDNERELLSGLSEEELATLDRILRKLLTHLEKAPLE